MNKLVHTYNSTKILATDHSQYYLLFGKKPRLAIHVLLPSQSNHTTSYSEYTKGWQDHMRQAYQIAKNHSDERKKNDINRYNTKVK